MNCPYCDEDLLPLFQRYYRSESGYETFEIICPGCGNNVKVVAEVEYIVSFDILKHDEE